MTRTLKVQTLAVIFILLFTSMSLGENFSGNVKIPREQITKDALFVPVEVDGVKMEVIAVEDSQGGVRTAFNTCQVCHGSELAYYKQKGELLECQTCGNRFSMEQVGVSGWGCNPFPILESQRTLSGDELVIPSKVFNDAKEIFSGWRTEY